MRGYRFLPLKFGLLALEEERLKIARLHELNDLFEWASPRGSQREHRRAFANMKQKMTTQSGLLCFSKNWHNPLMWSHYADHHRGLALGFDLPDEFFEVNYRKSRITCDWIKFLSFPDYALDIMQKVMASKFDHWLYEEEVRAHVTLDHSTEENGLYFFDFYEGLRLKEIVVGADCQISKEEIQSRIEAGQQKANIVKARLAFRDFRIVRQKNQLFW